MRTAPTLKTLIMKCPHCNSEIEHDSRFCKSCGRKVRVHRFCYSKVIKVVTSLKSILLSIAVGIWVLVLQNCGIFPANRNVRVTNAVEASVSGSVAVDNTVDVNLMSINGHRDVFFRLAPSH